MRIVSVAVDSVGNVYLSGYSVDTYGDGDMLLAQYNSLGVVTWSAYSLRSGNDRFNGGTFLCRPVK